MTEEKFAESEHYKINGKYFHPKNYWPGCLSSVQLKLSIDLIFDPVQPFSEASFQLFIRDQTAYAISTVSLETQLVFFNKPVFFSLRSLY